MGFLPPLGGSTDDKANVDFQAIMQKLEQEAMTGQPALPTAPTMPPEPIPLQPAHQPPPAPVERTVVQQMGMSGKAVVEGSKDVARDVTTGVTALAEASLALRNWNRIESMERSKPFSMFTATDRASYADWVNSNPSVQGKSREEVAQFMHNPEVRVEYLRQMDKRFAKAMETTRNYVNQKMAADPNYVSGGWIEDFFRMGPQIATQVATAALTGGVGSTAVMFAQIAGNRTNRLLAQGKDLKTAASYGLIDGLLQAPLEAIGLSKAMKWATTRTRIAAKLKAMAMSGLSEGITEYLQAYPELGVTLFSEKTDETTLKKVEEMVDIMSDPKWHKGALKEATIAGIWGALLTNGKKQLESDLNEYLKKRNDLVAKKVEEEKVQPTPIEALVKAQREAANKPPIVENPIEEVTVPTAPLQPQAPAAPAAPAEQAAAPAQETAQTLPFESFNEIATSPEVAEGEAILEQEQLSLSDFLKQAQKPPAPTTPVVEPELKETADVVQGSITEEPGQAKPEEVAAEPTAEQQLREQTGLPEPEAQEEQIKLPTWVSMTKPYAVYDDGTIVEGEEHGQVTASKSTEKVREEMGKAIKKLRTEHPDATIAYPNDDGDFVSLEQIAKGGIVPKIQAKEEKKRQEWADEYAKAEAEAKAKAEAAAAKKAAKLALLQDLTPEQKALFNQLDKKIAGAARRMSRGKADKFDDLHQAGREALVGWVRLSPEERLAKLTNKETGEVRNWSPSFHIRNALRTESTRGTGSRRQAGKMRFEQYKEETHKPTFEKKGQLIEDSDEKDYVSSLQQTSKAKDKSAYTAEDELEADAALYGVDININDPQGALNKLVIAESRESDPEVKDALSKLRKIVTDTYMPTGGFVLSEMNPEAQKAIKLQYLEDKRKEAQRKKDFEEEQRRKAEDFAAAKAGSVPRFRFKTPGYAPEVQPMEYGLREKGKIDKTASSGAIQRTPTQIGAFDPDASYDVMNKAGNRWKEKNAAVNAKNRLFAKNRSEFEFVEVRGTKQEGYFLRVQKPYRGSVTPPASVDLTTPEKKGRWKTVDEAIKTIDTSRALTDLEIEAARAKYEQTGEKVSGKQMTKAERRKLREDRKRQKREDAQKAEMEASAVVDLGAEPKPFVKPSEQTATMPVLKELEVVAQQAQKETGYKMKYDRSVEVIKGEKTQHMFRLTDDFFQNKANFVVETVPGELPTVQEVNEAAEKMADAWVTQLAEQQATPEATEATEPEAVKIEPKDFKPPVYKGVQNKENPGVVDVLNEDGTIADTVEWDDAKTLYGLDRSNVELTDERLKPKAVKPKAKKSKAKPKKGKVSLVPPPEPKPAPTPQIQKVIDDAVDQSTKVEGYTAALSQDAIPGYVDIYEDGDLIDTNVPTTDAILSYGIDIDALPDDSHLRSIEDMFGANEDLPELEQPDTEKPISNAEMRDFRAQLMADQGHTLEEIQAANKIKEMVVAEDADVLSPAVAQKKAAREALIEEIYDVLQPDPETGKTRRLTKKEIQTEIDNLLTRDLSYVSPETTKMIRDAFGDKGMKQKGGLLGNKGETTMISDLARAMQGVADFGGRVGHKLYDLLDVEAPFIKAGAPDVGRAFKNYFSKKSVFEIQGEQDAREFMDVVWNSIEKPTDVQMEEILLAYENKDYRKQLSTEKQEAYAPAIQWLSDYFAGEQMRFQSHGLDADFIGRRIKQLEAEIEALTMEHGKKGISEQMLDAQEHLETLLKMEDKLAKFEQMEFASIPMQVLFDKALQKSRKGTRRQRTEARKQLMDWRSNIEKQRRAVSLWDMKKNPKFAGIKFNPVDVIMNYAYRGSKDLALIEIRDEMVRADMLRAPKKGQRKPAGWGQLGQRYGILKGYYAPPSSIDALDGLFSVSDKQNPYDKFIGATKMMQFYNPLFLPAYDALQSVMSGVWVGKQIFKSPKYMIKAAQSVLTKDQDYQLAMAEGLFSKPFDSPFQDYKYRMRAVSKSMVRRTDWIGTAGRIAETFLREEGYALADRPVLNTLTFRPLYQASFGIAWSLDEMIRMTTYQALRAKKGMTVTNAAQLAAKFHGDYASVPPNTRRWLNRIFFTPTFKIVMGKYYASAVNGAWRHALGSLKGNTTASEQAVTRALARAGLGIMAVNAGMDFAMRLLGYKPDDEEFSMLNYGRKYIRSVKDKFGPADLTFTWSNPANLIQRYAQRIAKMWESGNPLDLIKYDLHPIFNILNNAFTNKTFEGSQIYNDFDETHVKNTKRIAYIGGELIKAYAFIHGKMDSPGTTSHLKGRSSIRRESKQIQRQINFFLQWMEDAGLAHSYVRDRKDRRIAMQMQRNDRMMMRMIQRGMEQGMTPQQLREIQDMYRKRQKELMKESKQFKKSRGARPRSPQGQYTVEELDAILGK